MATVYLLPSAPGRSASCVRTLQADARGKRRDRRKQFEIRHRAAAFVIALHKAITGSAVETVNRIGSSLTADATPGQGADKAQVFVTKANSKFLIGKPAGT
jgi:hypothetical protein